LTTLQATLFSPCFSLLLDYGTMFAPGVDVKFSFLPCCNRSLVLLIGINRYMVGEVFG